MGRKSLIVAGTLALALIIVVWQRTISAHSDAPQLACEPGLTTWLAGTSAAHTPVLLYWDGRAVGGGSSDAAGRWSLPLRVGDERSGMHMVEVRSRSNRALVGAFQCAVGGSIPTPAPVIALPTLVPTEQPTLVPSATNEPEPTVLTDFTPEPTEGTSEPTQVMDATAEPTNVVDATPTPLELGVLPQGIDCPPGYPIKGAIVTDANNNTEKIYYVPLTNGYDAAIPARCFSGTIDAEAAGYHAAQ
jgi:hypothetical protein